MDAELRELERLFEAAQQAKPIARLSERNVVELVLKLQQLGLLDADLLHTVSGKEYVTQEHLQHEMEIEINRLGRVSLVDLASSIGVDLYHCERQAEHIVSKNSGLMLVQGEVISTTYWDNLAEEVNETLNEASQVSLGELARRFNVGAELLTGILSSRIGTIVHGKLEAGQLYTPAYVARVKAMVRGAIRALTVPTSLQSVWSSLQSQIHDKDEAGHGGVTGESSLFHMVLNELLSEGSIKGTLRGGASTWTPAVFAQSQRESVEAFYSQNSYISYAALKKLNIPQPKQYLQTKYPEGIALETVFVHSSFVGLLDSAADEAITGGGWFDALDVVPSAFGNSDSAKLLLLCPSVKRAIKESVATQVADTCIVSTSFVKALLERFQTLLQDAQEKSAAIVITANGANKEESREQPEVDDSDKPKQINAKSRKEKKKDQDIETTEEESKPGKAKRKSGKSKGGKAVKDAVSKGTKGPAAEENDVPSEEKLAEKIIEWFPDLEAAGTEDGDTGVLAKSLAIQLRPSLILYGLSLKRAHLNSKTEERRKSIDALQQKINEDYASLQLFSKALDLFEDDKGMEAILHKHLLRTIAAEIADIFLEAQVVQHRLENPEGAEAQTPLLARPFTTATRMSLAKSLPGSLSLSAIEMVETLEGKNILAFESALDSAVRESGLRVKKLDKKGERTFFHTYRKSLMEQVEQEEDPIALLPKVVALLYAQVHGRALQTPGRALSSAVARLKTAISEEAYSVLEHYHASTVALLSKTSTADDSRRADLEQRMGALKAITRAAPVKA